MLVVVFLGLFMHLLWDQNGGTVHSLNCDEEPTPVIPKWLAHHFSCGYLQLYAMSQYLGATIFSGLVQIDATQLCLFAVCSCLEGGLEEAKINTIFSQRSPPTLKKGRLFFFVAVQPFNLSSTLVGEFSRRQPPLHWMSRPLIIRAQEDLPVNSPLASS